MYVFPLVLIILGNYLVPESLGSLFSLEKIKLHYYSNSVEMGLNRPVNPLNIQNYINQRVQAFIRLKISYG